MIDPRWWQDKSKDKHNTVWSTMTSMRNDNELRRDKMRALERLYDEDKIDDDTWSAIAAKPDAFVKAEKCRTRFNVVQNSIDTVHAQITSNNPRVTIVTIGGDFELQQRAKAATSFVDGVFDMIEVDELMPTVMKDALIAGTGAVKVFYEDGKIHAERVWTGNILVDRVEAANNCIRTVYQLCPIDRSKLKELFPKHRDEIDDAEGYDDDELTNADSTDAVGDMVLLVEAWHLPSTPGAKDGRHIACVSNATLIDEEWTRQTFPIVFLRYSKPARGFWGIGLAERMAGIQYDLNRISAKVAESFDLSAPFGVVEATAELNVKQIDNTPHRWYTTTTPPGQSVMWLTPDAISEQHLRREETLIERGYELNGVSQFAAQAQKPAGLNSGKAMLVHQDVASGRMTAPSRRYEQAHVDLAKAIIDALEDCDDEERKEIEAYSGDKEIEAIKYEECRMRDKPHKIRVFPVSALSKSPQGKIQELMDMASAGLFADTPEAQTMRDLMNLPDLEAENARSSAGRRLVDKLIDKCMEGQPQAAIPEMPLEYAVKQGTLQLNLAAMQGASPKVQEALRRFIGSARTILEKTAQAQQAQMQAMQAMQAPPQAPPMPGPPALPGEAPV